ncbi:MAG: hypothetical protein HQK72_13130 [Desulfamplus sp.]|nr:hypothetical protein [Desulfamplus sp.]
MMKRTARCCTGKVLLVHRSLSSQLPTTPAMEAGITAHLWSVKELLEYKVRPKPWICKGKGRTGL